MKELLLQWKQHEKWFWSQSGNAFNCCFPSIDVGDWMVKYLILLLPAICSSESFPGSHWKKAREHRQVSTKCHNSSYSLHGTLCRAHSWTQLRTWRTAILLHGGEMHDEKIHVRSACRTIQTHDQSSSIDASFFPKMACVHYNRQLQQQIDE